MAEFLNIEIAGEAELTAQLRAAVARLENPRELLGDIGALMERNTQRRFDTRRDPSGQPWQPLAASTLAKYRRQYKGRIPGSLLNRSVSGNSLRSSLASNVGDGYVDVGFSRLTDDRQWNVSALHEYGTTRMPRRGLLTADPEAGELGAQDREDILELVREYLDDAFA